MPLTEVKEIENVNAGTQREVLRNTDYRLTPLRVALVAVGTIFIVGIYSLSVVWPSGWTWHISGPSMYLEMIEGIYATLGVFLLIAARSPLKHLSLIWFTVWSSVVHSGIMGAQALVYPEHRGHLVGDVPALLLIAIALAVLTPRARKAEA